MGTFKPLQPAALSETADRVSDDAEYWGRLKAAVFDTAITQPVWLQSRFRSNVFGLRFRDDGQFLGMGSLDGYVHFFDVGKKGLPSKHALRVFQAHQCEVRTLSFLAKSTNCATFGDDGEIKLWDLALSKNDEPIYRIEKAHDDRIRASAASHQNPNVFVSGAYDHTVKLWDTRQKEKQGSQIKVDHGFPVESLLLHANDRVVVSAGGNVVKFWDLAAGCKLMHTLESHNRTVTSLALSSDRRFLLTGGLDRRIHVYRVDRGSFERVTTISTAAAVLSMDLAMNNECLAFGMNNLLSIHRIQPKPKQSQAPYKAGLVGTGKVMKYRRQVITQKEGTAPAHTADVTAKHVEQIHLGKLDVLLRGCQFRKVIDQVFKDKQVRMNKPEIVVAALKQLKTHGVLPTALSGRQGTQLTPILKFVSTNFHNPAFIDVLSTVGHVLFTLYMEESLTNGELHALREMVGNMRTEVNSARKLRRAMGISNSLLATVTETQLQTAAQEDDGDVFGEPLLSPKIFSLRDDAEPQLNGNKNGAK